MYLAHTAVVGWAQHEDVRPDRKQLLQGPVLQERRVVNRYILKKTWRITNIRIYYT